MKKRRAIERRERGEEAIFCNAVFRASSRCGDSITSCWTTTHPRLQIQHRLRSPHTLSSRAELIADAINAVEGSAVPSELRRPGLLPSRPRPGSFGVTHHLRYPKNAVILTLSEAKGKDLRLLLRSP
jgi:hypothetical protein